MQADIEARDAGMTSGASYIHWHNERSPYAVELREGLVRQILEEAAAAEEIGVEAGGVLVGTFPRGSELTVRIDRIIPINRRAKDGPGFVLHDEQQERFRAAVREANTRETSAVGIFRTHRGSPLMLSVEDRRLSAEEFRNSVHLILVVGSSQPRRASIFISKGLQAPPEVAVPEFSFGVEELRSVATNHPGVALTTVPEGFDEQRADVVQGDAAPAWMDFGNRQWWLIGLAAALIAIGAFAVGFISRPLIPGSQLERQLPHSDAKLELKVVRGTGRVVQILWNHQAPVIYDVKHGLLEISDGLQSREVALSESDLETGSIAYERVNDRILITLILTMRDGSTVSESCSLFTK